MNDELPAPDSDRTEIVLRAGVRCFGRYTLAGFLGQGGMGVVWLARDEKLEREVALKFLPEHVRRDPEAVRDLKREVKRCLDLTHVSIVRVHDFVEDVFAAAIAMEYVAGQSLATRKAAKSGGCFDTAELAPLVAQLCAALEFAHEVAHVVHRDLKPANLLVTDAGRLKVADFGIARSLAETQTRLTRDLRATSATLTFASPQQLNGDDPSAADDIYSLGATLYDLLTGKPPFFRGEVFQQIQAAAPEPLAVRRAKLENTGAPIPREWEETILACLAKHPPDRPASVAEIPTRLNLVGALKPAGTRAPVGIDIDRTERIEISARVEPDGTERIVIPPPVEAPALAVPALAEATPPAPALTAPTAPEKETETPTDPTPPAASDYEPAQSSLPTVGAGSPESARPLVTSLQVPQPPSESTASNPVPRAPVPPASSVRPEAESSVTSASLLYTSESRRVRGGRGSFFAVAGVLAVGLLWLIFGGRDGVIEVRSTPPGIAPKFAVHGRPWTIPGLNLTLLPIAAGTFTMGSESGYSDEKPLTRVDFTQPFWLGRTEVTQREWQTVMGSNPSMLKGENLPIETVSWEEAMEFCRKLTARERAAERLPAGYGYTLPTEAQWEYACRAGATGDYAGALGDMAWCSENSGNRTQVVATKKPNAWGLYDMHGNVWEWCADWYADNLPGSTVLHPAGAASGTHRVYRGGCWGSTADSCRSANRDGISPGNRYGNLGFRLALSARP